MENKKIMWDGVSETDEKIIDAFGKVISLPDDNIKKRICIALAELTDDEWVVLEKLSKKIVGEK